MTKIHLSLNVANVEASTKWYAAFFGQDPHKVREGYANFDVESPAIKLALNEGKACCSGALNHLGILVEDSKQVWDAKSRLETAGFETKVEEAVVCCHAKQDKFWVNDPDGNAWEIYTITDDAATVTTPGSACCA